MRGILKINNDLDIELDSRNYFSNFEQNIIQIVKEKLFTVFILFFYIINYILKYI